MPESVHAKRILAAMKKQYGKKGEDIYYATANKEGRDFATFHKKRLQEHLKKKGN